MRAQEELIELRAERLALVRLLNRCKNSRRQELNKRLTDVNKKIQRMCGFPVANEKAGV